MQEKRPVACERLFRMSSKASLRASLTHPCAFYVVHPGRIEGRCPGETRMTSSARNSSAMMSGSRDRSCNNSYRELVISAEESPFNGRSTKKMAYFWRAVIPSRCTRTEKVWEAWMRGLY
jgi:hypothetical protein